MQNNRNNKNQEKLMVYKANKLIEARYSLDLNEQKLILFAASQINNFTGDNFTILKMSVSDFFSVSGVDEKSKNHKYVKQLAKNLMGKQLEIELPNGDWEMIQWVSRCKYENDKGIIEFEFSPSMKPYLLNLGEKFKGYPLQQVIKLNSKYSIRLYELLIQWGNTKHKSFTITVEELRRKMGVGNNMYQRFSQFEDRVIKTAVTELNNLSNIIVKYDKIKEGRYISEINFKFRFKGEYSKEELELKKIMEAGLGEYIIKAKEALNDPQLLFTDHEIDKAYKLVTKKLENIKSIEKFLEDAIYGYMLYYYEYTKEKADRHAYNYYYKALDEDYDRLQIVLKYSADLSAIKYGELLK